MNNTNNALETLVQRDKQIKKTNDKLKASINELNAELETTTNALSTHASNTDIHTSKEELIQLIVDHLESLDLGITKEVVSVLPTENISDNTLYFVPNDKGSHNEYLYINDMWELVGSTETNFTDYYTKQETDTLLEGKANSVHNHVVSDITDFPTIPTKVSELSNDSNFVTSTELHDYATKNDLNSKQDALSEEQLSNIDSIPDKANKSDLATVATSGSYKDLLDKPVIPEGSDLSDYYNKGETDNLLNSKANTSDLAVVAKSGNYSDLNNTPTIPTKTSQLINDSGFLTSSSGVITSVSWSDITDKPNFSTVATSGSYNDLSNKPTIPNVYNKTLTIQKNGTNVATFTSNSNTDVTADITVPTKVSELSNDSGFITGISWDKVTNKPTLATVATSGSYTDLSNTPTIPTKVSQLENDSGFINALADVVDTKSNQTINGTKTFTSTPFVSGGGTTTGIYLKNTAIARNEVPSQLYHATFRAYDKNDKILGEYCVEKSTTGCTLLHMNVRSEDSNGNQLSESLYLNMSNDGSVVRFYPSSDNKVDLGMSNHKWAKIYSDDVVHTSGDENISGNKTFSNTTISNKELHYKDTKYDWSDKSLNVWNDAGHVVWFDKTGNRRMHELVGANGGVWRKACYINENQYFSVDSNRNISYWGTATFNGHTIFTQDMIFKNNYIDLTVTPANILYSNFIFRDKNNQNVAYIQYAKRNTDPDILGLFINDKDKNLHGIQITSNNYLLPFGNNIYNLGSPNNKWANIYATTFNGNLKGNADTATSANDPNAVHKTGNETITGFKSFTEVLDRRNDVTISTVATATQLVDTNANRCGWIANRMHWAGNYHVHNRHIAYNENSGKEVYIDIISSNNGSGGLFVGGTATNRNLNDVTSATDHTALATMGWVNNPATSTNVVHRSGDETITGNKTFSNRVSFPCGYYLTTDIDKNSLLIIREGSNHGNIYKFIIQGDTGKIYAPNGFIGNLQGNADSATHATTAASATTATSASKASSLDNYSLPGGNKIYLDWDHQVKGYVGLKVDNTVMGGLITTKNIGSQAANSATYATTQATTDNSTKIATTAWVRTYVNSVGAVGVTFVKGTNYWYRKHSDGFIEMGGFTSCVDKTGNAVATNMPLAFSNTNYTLIVQLTHGTRDGDRWGDSFTLPFTRSKSTTGFVVFSSRLTDGNGYDWYACGY